MEKGTSTQKVQPDGTVFEESDECVDWLEYFRDTRIQEDPGLIQEARELAMIFAKARKTARANTNRIKNAPKS